MKYSILILLSILLYSCEKTSNKLVIGTWIGTQYPEADTVIFAKNTVQFTGAARIEGEQSYSIDNNNIYVTDNNGEEIILPYEFIDEDKIYIEQILKGLFGLDDDGAIEFSKQ